MFTNSQIDITTLPKLEDLKLEPISPKYFTIIIINVLVTYLSFIGALVVLKYFIEDDDGFHSVFWYIIVVLILASISQMIIYKLGFKKRKYALREKDIIYSSGYIVNNTTTLPLNRIQHLEITRSFMARRLGLATLKIYSAGESGGDIAIKGLPNAIAEKQYAHLTSVLNDRV
ncbi:PH domain-containing protein [Winogradskyella immobilis]|uniref:PH domain-containing protein n=1 Tax=Winogradskyella immobilis TaxID=2816852 RepID=A0ABS8ER36_9FLAO|nr:PH domain-containing protein [Winogradskyella immobilis]MCC1485351.1 PH domain-containing protein [Winogradskyella immobilis]MCG0017443.1 PH domain-containing protein [Winogradskyella immobilis]